MGKSMRPLRILVVDDHSAVRRSICQLLELHPGWNVCGEAADGGDAIEKVNELEPDCVLMDITMPGMDGASASKIIRATRPDIEIILVSQNDGPVVDQVAQQIGAAASVAKASLARDLLPTIERVVSHHDPSPHES
jgi:two-component system, NarL family, response regulator NreC